MNDPYNSENFANGGTTDYRPTPVVASLEIGDIYYTLFRHKWKIIVCGVLGLGAATYLFLTAPKNYRSEARLFIRYIQEEKNPAAEAGGTVRQLGGDSIISSEIAILSSLDVAQKVADTVGHEKILGVPATPEGKFAAAAAVQGGLGIDVPRYSSVIEVTFLHTNAALVQPILSSLIDQYLTRHREVHTPSGAFDDSLVQQTDTLQARLRRTEEELLAARKSVGIISLDESKKTFGEQIGSLRAAIFQAEAGLAERVATYNRIMSSSDSPIKSDQIKVEPDAPLDLTGAPVEDYQAIVDRIAFLKRRQSDLLTTLQPGSDRVKEVRGLIVDFENKRKTMETEFPVLVRIPKPTPVPTGNQQQDPNAFNPLRAKAEIAAFTTRVQVLNTQLEKLRVEIAEVDKAEVNIRELELRKSMEEANFRYLKSSLEQSRINDALGTGRVTNISIIQSPSPPFRVTDKSIKIAVIVGLGGFVLGVVWAFVTDFLLDRTIKRPIDVTRHAGLSLYLTIPALKKRRPAAIGAPKNPVLTAGKDDGQEHKSSLAITAWQPDSRLQPYYDTLRDRVIGFFESENLTHKPKLIALAGVGKNANDASVAAGLASSLSETEGGNVLYVDMTTGQGSTQQFFKGQAVGSIDDALQSKDTAQVQQNLFVVSEVGKGDRLPRALPMRFSHLIPKLKASDFDFIIFNMPSVSSVSVTPRLAAFMDVVLLVVESEHTDRDLVNRARDLLAESKTPVGAILNNTRTYVPKLIYQDPSDSH